MRGVWSPFREPEELFREMSRLFEAFRPREGASFRSAFLPGRSARAYPLINLYEDPEAIRIEALAPGLDTESLDVSVRNDQLTLTGQKKPLEGVNEEAYHRSERSTGKFVRVVNLNSEVDSQHVTAEYEDGILRITLPKSERAKPKQISVSVK